MQHLTLPQGQVWFDETLLKEDPVLCFDADFWQQQNALIGSAQGRGTTWFVRGEKVDMALRHYRRGGLFGKLVADAYWFTGWQQTRSYQELMLLQKLAQGGVNVPRPVAARAIKRGLTYHADILVEKVPNAQDLVGLLIKQGLPESVWQQIGQTVAKMHQLQVNHTDLNAHNILFDEQGQVWLIDFDKCYEQKGKAWQQGNLDRLLRSFHKEVGKRKIHFNQADWQALMAGYQG
ncbi:MULTISPECIES: 3-deoxy-D-manno-octulosonic acid kinase [unclassified Motilimonas]|uniref:3-deoxy-D-manno-octulosonic acid kinase n=1 Tax=unclassified Motilimonas TaxID=2643697 RepID=UPI001E288154|nr:MULTISPECIES: 3-deoxy-D-manno-octulosonic acid kinase [unclassified Motilimonas]MCE0558854.1 3-deoxy-D-manno-octulosonic acid kinase [Motilimonas sp. E26]MDO6526833.1 3-deoxy-D-manno-octulosonic acid kinase [Motilimonas sp. 1_MG-2023]